MTKRIRLIGWAVIVLLLGACAHTQKPESALPKASAQSTTQGLTAKEVALFFPLSVGAFWRYKVERMGNQLSWTRKIVKSENGEFVDSEGARFVRDAFGVRDQNRYFLRANVPVGFRWWAQLDYKRRQWLRFVSMDEKVQVPAGEFSKCVLIEASMLLPDGRKWIERSWFARNVGMVKREVYVVHPAGGKKLTERAELAEFKVK